MIDVYQQNNFLIDAIESDNEDGGEYQLMPQEQLINYSLTLDVEGTAAHGFYPSRDGEGTVGLTNKIQLDSHGRLLTVVYAVNNMGYNNPQNSIATKKPLRWSLLPLCLMILGTRRYWVKQGWMNGLG